MYYCGVCATQAASQGFNVNRINNVPQKKQKNIPYLPNHANNKRYIELTGLMKDILKLENEFKSVIENIEINEYEFEGDGSLFHSREGVIAWSQNHL